MQHRNIQSNTEKPNNCNHIKKCLDTQPNSRKNTNRLKITGHTIQSIIDLQPQKESSSYWMIHNHIQKRFMISTANAIHRQWAMMVHFCDTISTDWAMVSTIRLPSIHLAFHAYIIAILVMENCLVLVCLNSPIQKFYPLESSTFRRRRDPMWIRAKNNEKVTYHCIDPSSIIISDVLQKKLVFLFKSKNNSNTYCHTPKFSK